MPDHGPTIARRLSGIGCDVPWPAPPGRRNRWVAGVVEHGIPTAGRQPGAVTRQARAAGNTRPAGPVTSPAGQRAAGNTRPTGPLHPPQASGPPGTPDQPARLHPPEPTGRGTSGRPPRLHPPDTRAGPPAAGQIRKDFPPLLDGRAPPARVPISPEQNRGARHHAYRSDPQDRPDPRRPRRHRRWHRRPRHRRARRRRQAHHPGPDRP